MVDLRYGELRSYRDLLAKLKRDAETFANNPSSDNLFNAVITAWSLTDWVHADAPLSVEMDSDLEQLTGRDSSGRKRKGTLSTQMQICQDLANGSKHAKITLYKPSVQDVGHGYSSYGEGEYGLARYGGGAYFYIAVGDQFYDAEEVIEQVVNQFNDFLARHDLL